MALLQSTDRLLVQRSGASYRATFEELSTSLGINPDGDLDINGDLDVSGSVILGTPNSGCTGTLAIHNATTIACSLDVTGNSTYAGNLGIAGAQSSLSSAISSFLTVGTSATVGTTLDVTGLTTIAGGLAVTSGTSSDSLIVSGLSTLTGAVTAGSTLNVVAATTLGDTLGVEGNATFAANVSVDGTTTSKGKLTVQDDADVTGAVSANSLTTTTTVTAGSALDVGTSATIGGTATIGGNVDIGTGKVTVTAVSGDATYAGTVTAGFFAGDGSQLTNLQIPGSLVFQGSIDCVTQDAPAAVSGDFLLNTGTGTIKADGNWAGISGAIEEGDFVYYDGASWSIGGGNDDGFVTLTTAQNITGGKTFTSAIIASDGLSAGAGITGTTVALSGKAISADTIDGDASATLTTKGYVDTQATNAITKEVLKSGDYLTGADFDGSTEITFTVEGTEAATPLKLVARDAQGDVAVRDIAANDYTGKDIVLTNSITAVSSDVVTAAVTGTATVNILDVTTSAVVGTTLDVTGLLTGTTANFTTSVAAVAYTGTSTTLSGALAADTAAIANGCSAGSFTTTGTVNAGVFNIDALDTLPATP